METEPTTEPLEKIVDSPKTEVKGNNIDIGRIGINTLFYGLSGLAFPNPSVAAPLTAIIGFAATTYDEVKREGMDLFYPAIGLLTGGLLGRVFGPDSSSVLGGIISYGGGLAGGAVGAYKSWFSKDPKQMDYLDNQKNL